MGRILEKTTMRYNILKGVIYMPGRDGTGPISIGPMTNRNRGFCGLRNSAEFAKRRDGKIDNLNRGFFCRGWGVRDLFEWPFFSRRAKHTEGQDEIYSFNSKNSEINYLKNQSKYFSQSLEKINSRLAELEKDN